MNILNDCHKLQVPQFGRLLMRLDDKGQGRIHSAQLLDRMHRKERPSKFPFIALLTCNRNKRTSKPVAGGSLKFAANLSEGPGRMIYISSYNADSKDSHCDILTARDICSICENDL